MGYTAGYRDILVYVRPHVRSSLTLAIAGRASSSLESIKSASYKSCTSGNSWSDLRVNSRGFSKIVTFNGHFSPFLVKTPLSDDPLIIQVVGGQYRTKSWKLTVLTVSSYRPQ